MLFIDQTSTAYNDACFNDGQKFLSSIKWAVVSKEVWRLVHGHAARTFASLIEILHEYTEWRIRIANVTSELISRPRQEARNLFSLFHGFSGERNSFADLGDKVEALSKQLVLLKVLMRKNLGPKGGVTVVGECSSTPAGINFCQCIVHVMQSSWT